MRLVARDLGVQTDTIARSTGVEPLTLAAPLATQRPNDHVPHAAWAGVDWRTDAHETVETLRSWRPDWVVVDVYAFDARWHRLVGDELATRIAVIDDLADRELHASVLVDHNPSDSHHDKYLGKRPPQGALLSGPRFALLGPGYVQSSPFAVAPEVRGVGIFMGGTDAAALSCIALRACREHAGFTGPIEIVTTRANPRLQQLLQLVQKWPATTLSVDLPDLAAFFGRHDLQIGAGGGAAWERCCVGVPTLMLSAADNQEAVVAALVVRGAAAALAPSAANTASAVGEALRSLLNRTSLPLRQQLSERSQALVDGLGAKRVALKLSAETLTVRAATVEDSQTMHLWRNHPATRATSHDSREIAWCDHVDWLQRTLANASHHLLIGRVGQIDVGVIRFDMAAPAEAKVSLYLDPALHGLGLGRQLLLAGEAQQLRRNGGLHFVASVLQGNAVSQRLFEQSGYEFRHGLWRKHGNAPRAKGEGN